MKNKFPFGAVGVALIGILIFSVREYLALWIALFLPTIVLVGVVGAIGYLGYRYIVTHRA